MQNAYVNRPESRPVTGSHVLVEGLDGVCPRCLAVLFVHVVGTGAGVVADPDAKVLDFLGALLVDLEQCASAYAVHRHAQFLIQHTTFSETISPFVFLILRSFARKYQNRDLATTSFTAKMRMR